MLLPHYCMNNNWILRNTKNDHSSSQHIHGKGDQLISYQDLQSRQCDHKSALSSAIP